VQVQVFGNIICSGIDAIGISPFRVQGD